MSEEDQTISRTLNADEVADSGQRVEQAVARASTHVALVDGVSFVCARLWSVLAVIAAPLFALLGKHALLAAERAANPSGDSSHE